MTNREYIFVKINTLFCWFDYNISQDRNSYDIIGQLSVYSKVGSCVSPCHVIIRARDSKMWVNAIKTGAHNSLTGSLFKSSMTFIMKYVSVIKRRHTEPRCHFLSKRGYKVRKWHSFSNIKLFYCIRFDARDWATRFFNIV